jgi:hypothetical protein
VAKKHHLGLIRNLKVQKQWRNGWRKVRFAYVRWWEGWDSSDMEFSGERASGSTKQARKASRKEIPRPPPLADDAVVATEKRDSSPLPPGSVLRLPAEPVPLTLLIMACSPAGAARLLRRRAETQGGLLLP